jgi:riboflavin kinase / FMN adenylyltransferase
MDVVEGIDRLRAEHGPILVVVGVFDGMHRGHAYLLHQLVETARLREARPAVITFDHHPDEVITGRAPALLLDPEDRLDLLAAAGVAVTVVQHFDAALRQTPYDAFVERIRARVELRGFVMTPDAAFGFERRGTPDALAELGRRDGFEVFVVPPFTIDGQDVRSSTIRTAIARGDLATAERLLGRPVTISGTVAAGPSAADGLAPLEPVMPIALPPDGDYAALVEGDPRAVRIEDGRAYLVGGGTVGRVSARLVAVV